MILPLYADYYREYSRVDIDIPSGFSLQNMLDCRKFVPELKGVLNAGSSLLGSKDE